MDRLLCILKYKKLNGDIDWEEVRFDAYVICVACLIGFVAYAVFKG